MGYKESLEELIDEYESDEPFLTVGARAVLATYRRMLEEEKAINSGGLNKHQASQSKPSVRRLRLPRRRTK
jgi:hypothetical protein